MAPSMAHGMAPTTIVRGTLLHTPRNPFTSTAGLVSIEHGALVFAGSTILATGTFTDVQRSFPDAEVLDWRTGYILPGLIDTHVHFPQVPVIGSMGLPLLDWLSERTLPAEARCNTPAMARTAAREFLTCLAANGTTSALVFGSHLVQAQDVFFEEALRSGLRITSGLVLGDRNLIPELETTVERAAEESRDLIARYHGRDRLRYAVTPRFSVSCSEAMLELCGALLRESPGLFFQTHINENDREIALVRRLFPEARDYFDTYERHGLAGERSVFAHNLHVSDGELSRMAGCGCSVAHCPSSNAFLGSGSFPMARHHRHGVRFALGCDVGGGSGFSLFKEALRAYEAQMLRDDGYALRPAHLLYLASLAGAEVLGLEAEVGCLSPGKQADFVVFEPPRGSTAEHVLRCAPDMESTLGVLLTLCGEESVRATYVAGQPVYHDNRSTAAPRDTA